jgi:hypothetical protein
MTEHEASRTLVKSPPELWAECSEAASLARHLGEWGEIRITRLEPETAVAWEGERVSGTVRIEPSGWGTRVTLTAQVERVEVVQAVKEEPEPVAAEPEPVAAEPESVVARPPQPLTSAELLARAGFFSRMRSRFKRPAVAVAPQPMPSPTARQPKPVMSRPEPPPAAPEPEPRPALEPEPPAAPEPEPRPEAVTEPVLDAEQILVAALDSLGQAHHRPFSRS